MQAIADTVTYLRTVDSTNNYAMAQLHAGLARHGDVVLASQQTAGKGQRGKKWEARPGENLLMTIVVEPHLLITQQFHLSMAVALASAKTFQSYFNDSIAIKWPNDIYWNDRKAGGILIENLVREENWLYAAIGIGMNINQVSFDVEGSRPVSLRQLTGKQFSTMEIARRLCENLQTELDLLEARTQEMLEVYNNYLYKRNCEVMLKHHNVVSRYTISGVDVRGRLLAHAGIERVFKVGEVEWIIDAAL